MNEYRKLMESLDRINEDEESQEEQIAAVGQLIADRTEEEDSESKLKSDTFVNILNKMGLPATKESLMDLTSSGQVGAVIKDMNDDEVQFKGQRDIDPTQMTVDRARNTVDRMAKRQAKKGVYDKYE